MRPWDLLRRQSRTGVPSTRIVHQHRALPTGEADVFWVVAFQETMSAAKLTEHFLTKCAPVISCIFTFYGEGKEMFTLNGDKTRVISAPLITIKYSCFNQSSIRLMLTNISLLSVDCTCSGYQVKTGTKDKSPNCCCSSLFVSSCTISRQISS